MVKCKEEATINPMSCLIVLDDARACAPAASDLVGAIAII
jgi:hypothetical protein